VEPARTEPGQWLLRGLVKCGVCGVGTNCHKMRGRNGTWHRYYYCRNHDPIKAGGTDRRCTERNIRSDTLDTFVFDQVRAALLRPDVLTVGEQALAVRTPTPDDELLAAELARLDRKLDATDAERRRLIDLYQAGLVELPELQRRAADVEHRRRDLAERRDALIAQRDELTRDNQLRHRVRDFASRVLDVIDTLDFTQETDPAPPRRRRSPRHRLARPDPATDPARRQPRRPTPTAEPRPGSRPAQPGVNRRPSAFTW
jgi:site-specific DNA recombinase